jgi:hypothetical protein
MRKLASIQTVNAVEPIPNADAIEKIRVLGWWVVSKKGEHKVGDPVLYVEIDSLLPERLEFEFLRASSFKPAHDDIPAGFRIKTVTRMTWRRSWAIASKHPAASHRRACWYTAAHGGRSLGRYRQWPPVLTSQRTALKTDRRSCVR